MKKETANMLKLTPAQRRDLRAQAHHLDPVVSVAANGLTESVMKEIDLSLSAHELIKIRVYGDDREARNAIMENVCATLGCADIQHIGKLLVVFRPNPELHKPAAQLPRKTVLPAALRKQEPRRPGSRQTVGTSAARRLTSPRKAPAGGRPRTGGFARSVSRSSPKR